MALAIVDIVRPDLGELVHARLAYERAKREAPIEMVPAASTTLGPIRHPELRPELVNRIRVLREALLDVYPHSLTFWIDGFRRDLIPESELRFWEKIAACMSDTRRWISDPSELLEAFRLFLAMSMGIGRPRVT